MNQALADSRNSMRTSWARVPGRSIVIGMLIAAPWMLGSVGAWSQTLLCICGLVALAFWWLEIAVLRPQQIVIPLSVLPILLGVGLGVLHLAPLPESVAKTLGAEHAWQQWQDLTQPTAMDRAMVDQWALTSNTSTNALLQPATPSISLDPNATRLMTAQLVFAAIAYLLAAHFFHSKSSLTWLCVFLTANGVVLSLFGMIRKLSRQGDWLYGAWLGSGTNFGPYVNRNNAAGLLVMCLAAAVMLTVLVFHRSRSHTSSYWHQFLQTIHELDARKVACLASVMFIIAGIVVSLSRGGTLAILGGSLVALLVIGVHQREQRSGSLVFLGLAVGLGITLVAWLGFADQIMDRFEDANQADITANARVENWRDTSAVISKQWLVGSGLSTYQHVHRAYRTTPETGLFYFAENQYFQSLIDGGLVGLLLLLSMLAWVIYQIRYLIQTSEFTNLFPVAIFGCFALASQAVAAIFDFGLYMPANMLTFAVLMGAISGTAQAQAKRLGQSNLAARGLGRLGLLLILGLFAAGVLALLQFHERQQIDAACIQARDLIQRGPQAEPDLMQQNLEQLNGLAEQRPDADTQTAIASLLIHQYRVKQFLAAGGDPDQMESEVQKNRWLSTAPEANALYLRQLRSIAPQQTAKREANFRANPQLRQAILPAYAALLEGRRVSPMTAELHLRLAELGTNMTDLSADRHLERAISISPMNASYQMMAGVYQLRYCQFDSESEDFEPALDHLRSALKLNRGISRNLPSMIVQNRIMGVWVYGLSPEVYARELLIEMPDTLFNYAYAEPYFKEFPEARSRLYAESLKRIPIDPEIRYEEGSKLLALAKMALEVGYYKDAEVFADFASNKPKMSAESTWVKAQALLREGEMDQAEALRGSLEAQYQRAYDALKKRIVENTPQTPSPRTP